MGMKSTTEGGIYIGILSIDIFALVVFLVAKLSGDNIISNWSWWWILSPLWGIVGLFFIYAIISTIVIENHLRKESKEKERLIWQSRTTTSPAPTFKQKLESLPKPSNWRRYKS